MKFAGRTDGLRRYSTEASRQKALRVAADGDLHSAVLMLDDALLRDPDCVALLHTRGNLLSQLSLFEQAELDYRRCVALQPNHAEAWANLACMVAQRGHRAEAIAFLHKSCEINPSLPGLQGELLKQRQFIADWTDWALLKERLAGDLQRGQAALQPLVALALLDCPALQRTAAACHVAQRWGRPNVSITRQTIPSSSSAGTRRIRIAYISAHVHAHPLMMLLAGILESHDRTRVEVLLVSLGAAPAGDGWRRRCAGSADHWVDLSATRDERVMLEQLRSLQADVAVDLEGHAEGGRPGLWIQRFAPVQVSWLGFMGTSAIPTMDYIIADRVALPQVARQYMTERVIDLPVCFQGNDSWRRIGMVTPSRRACGLPDDAVVLCCFNQVFKINPDVFAAWMRILTAAPHTVLWLYVPDADTQARMRQGAIDAGVAAQRLVFAQRAAHPVYLARYRLADLFLDTWPYNAGTTASDALWTGLPVLTLAGQTLVARMGASLLSALGMPQLIAGDADGYVNKAIALASDSASLALLKKDLRRRRHQHPLFDSRAQAANLEWAFEIAVRRQRNNEGLSDIVVPSASGREGSDAPGAVLSRTQRLRRWALQIQHALGDDLHAVQSRRR